MFEFLGRNWEKDVNEVRQKEQPEFWLCALEISGRSQRNSVPLVSPNGLETCVDFDCRFQHRLIVCVNRRFELRLQVRARDWALSYERRRISKPLIVYDKHLLDQFVLERKGSKFCKSALTLTNDSDAIRVVADLVFDREQVIHMPLAQGLKHFFCAEEPKVCEMLAGILKEHVPDGKGAFFGFNRAAEKNNQRVGLKQRLAGTQEDSNFLR